MITAMEITIDPAGRIVVPKAVRDRLGLRGGHRLQLVEHEDSFELIPVALVAEVVEDHGVWRLRPAEPLEGELTPEAVRATLERTRSGR